MSAGPGALKAVLPPIFEFNDLGVDKTRDTV
jgi:hypothetical protein